ncbi:hypothetical protein ACP275_12G148600 [Erythranthe tilingii]
MLGITIGVSFSLVFPHWLISLLIIFLFLGTSSRSFAKAIVMWKKETILKRAMEEEKKHSTVADSHGQLLIDVEYEALVVPKEEKTTLQIIRGNLNLTRILVLVLLWTCFLLLQVIKLPAALAVFGYECVKLYKESKKRKIAGNT